MKTFVKRLRELILAITLGISVVTSCGFDEDIVPEEVIVVSTGGEGNHDKTPPDEDDD